MAGEDGFFRGEEWMNEWIKSYFFQHKQCRIYNTTTG